MATTSNSSSPYDTGHDLGPTAPRQRGRATHNAPTSRRRPGSEDHDLDDTTELVPVPLRFYALFIVPLLFLMFWALFLKR